MITISNKRDSVHECIGNQEYSHWVKYREFLFTLKKEMSNGMLWYNLMTYEVIFLSQSDLQKIEFGDKSIIQALVRRWFMIPCDIDDKTIVYDFWQKYKAKHPSRRNSPLSLVTIFTTTECNAKCPYCYEYGTAKDTMDEETALETAKYISNNSMNKLTLKWFGGEPLLNYKVIDIICGQLKKSGKGYSSYLVTNAYLFDKITDEQIVNQWNLKQVQITIDGTRNEYKKIKCLPDNAYDKVLKTIERLAHLQISVMIRVHVTNENSADIKKLIYELGSHFKKLGEKRKYIRLYAAPLFENLGEKPELLTAEKRNLLYDEYINIDSLISSSGIDHGRGFPKIKPVHCMADSGCSIVIAPNGNLTPCEHCHDKEVIGNVRDGGEIPDKWYEQTPRIPECKTCFYYPQCIRLKMCEAESPCNSAYRKFIKHQVLQVMQKAYDIYLVRRNTNAKAFKNCSK